VPASVHRSDRHVHDRAELDDFVVQSGFDLVGLDIRGRLGLGCGHSGSCRANYSKKQNIP
jgi:hypothetical protein